MKKSKKEEIIRVNHAGEYGAKRIYSGQIFALRNSNKNILENSKTFLSDELLDNELRLVMRKFELSRKILPS